jgi:hypothetical protein
MFKKFLAVMFVLTLALGAVATPAKAAVPVNYESSIQVRNLTGTAGTITLTFYDLSGTVVGTPLTDAIAANETKSYYQSTMPVASGFNGSVVISSDVEIAAMSNLVGLSAAASPISYAAYSGFSGGASAAYLPTLFKDNYGYNTFFYVQNTGVADTAVTVNYSDGTTANIAAIAPGQSVIVNQKTETHTPKVFSATLTSTVAPIAVTVVEEGSTLFSYTGFGSGAATPMMPLINQNNYGYFTGVQIMNTGTASTAVTVSYTPSLGGTACTETRTLPAGTSKTFSQFVFYQSQDESGDPAFATNCVMGQTFVGSAKVTANTAAAPLVAVVNQLQPTQVKGGAYVAFDPAEGGATIVYPLIMDRNWGYFTSHSIVNVGTTQIAAGALSCLFTGTDKTGPVSTTITNAAAIPVDASWTLNHQGLLGDGFVGGATCTGPVGALLVGTSNQLGASAGVDTLLVSEGFIVN